MGWHSLFLLILITLVGLFSFLILNLNSNIIHLDLVFYEFEISLGFVLLSFFLLGIFVTVILEIAFFFRKKVKTNE